MDREGSPLHEDEGKDGHEILRDYRGEREVELSPHVVVLMHAEIGLPRVVVYGAEGVVQIRPGDGCHRGEDVAHVYGKAHEAVERDRPSQVVTDTKATAEIDDKGCKEGCKVMLYVITNVFYLA